MKTKLLQIFMVLLPLLCVTGFVGTASGSPGYLTNFESQYPAAVGSRIDTCTLCHTSPPTRNPYGTAFANAGHSFTAIASADSDGDGFTNAQEIAALTFPGNASDHPTTAATLSSLAMSGPASVNAGATGTYTATASYSDGTTKSVTAAWSVNNSNATINASGVLTAAQVSSNQTVTVTASYTESGVTKTATKSVTITATAASLSSLAISGPASVNAGGTGTFAATASYSDGTTKSVTAAWSVNNSNATINASGVLTAAQVSSNQTVTVTASYTESGVTKTATKSVTITASSAAVLTGLSMSGPTSVNAGATATYTATASYSNGTSKAVPAAWSVNNSNATINASGVLTAAQVSSNQTVTVTASYSEGGVSQTANQFVTVVATTPSPQGGLLFHDDFSTATPDGSPYWMSVLGKWAGKTGAYSPVSKTTSIAVVANVPGMDQYETGRLQTNVVIPSGKGAKSASFPAAQVGIHPVKKIALQRIASTTAYAGIVFGYVDNAHYRYAIVLNNKVIIGQVGSYAGEKAGIKAAVSGKFAVNTWHQLQLDMYSDGLVNVYVDGQGSTGGKDSSRGTALVNDNNGGGVGATVSHAFKEAAAGQAGYISKSALSMFENFNAWDDTVLPVENPPNPNPDPGD